MTCACGADLATDCAFVAGHLEVAASGCLAFPSDESESQHGDVPPRRTSWTARDLLAAELPAPKYAVEGLFPEGLTFMAGAPKLGKSWLGLGLRIAVASGGHALGKIAVTQGDVLYLALEDNARRLRRSASAPARRRLRS